MFRVKICGITNTRDALAVAEAGADAIGLNFFPRSARFVEAAAAEAICRALPPEVLRIGLFVNAEPSRVREAFESLALDAVQLHGDETPEYLAELGPLPIIRALRLSDAGIAPVHEYLRAATGAGVWLKGVLLDSFRKGQYGGTGKTANWDEAAKYSTPEEDLVLPRLLLAGGLTSENVAAAVQTVRPYGVDTAGGVEQRPGEKSPEKIKAFVTNALTALRSTSSDTGLSDG